MLSWQSEDLRCTFAMQAFLILMAPDGRGVAASLLVVQTCELMQRLTLANEICAM